MVHVARREYGSVVYVNGGKIGTVATMEALERRKLIKRDGDETIAAVLRLAKLSLRLKVAIYLQNVVIGCGGRRLTITTMSA